MGSPASRTSSTFRISVLAWSFMGLLGLADRRRGRVAQLDLCPSGVQLMLPDREFRLWPTSVKLCIPDVAIHVSPVMRNKNGWVGDLKLGAGNPNEITRLELLETVDGRLRVHKLYELYFLDGIFTGVAAIKSVRDGSVLGEAPAEISLGCLVQAVFGSRSQRESLGTKREFRSQGYT